MIPDYTRGGDKSSTAIQEIILKLRWKEKGISETVFKRKIKIYPNPRLKNVITVIKTLGFLAEI